jgi:hypothetical protein
MTTIFLQQKFVNITNGTRIVTSLINNKSIGTPFHDNDVESLLKCHPNVDKVRNIQYLVVRKRPPYNRPALYIKNEGQESETDVSYKASLEALFDKYSKTKNNAKRIMKTFRDAINNTKRKEFKLNFTSIICQQCENVIENDLHIDHNKYTFQQILDEFIGDKKIHFHSIKVFEKENNEHEFEDKELQLNWVNYHDEKAIFKGLCKKCNLSNGTYGYKKNLNLYML